MNIYHIYPVDITGKVPAWLVNRASQIVAPKMAGRIHKVARAYPAWKEKNRPHHKPWINPEQICIPRLDRRDICSMDEVLQKEVIDESELSEENGDMENGSNQDLNTLLE